MDKPNLKYWLVKLRMVIGEYEKTSKHFVEAETAEEAGNIAFSYEQHCDDAEWDEDQQSFIDDHGGMAYRVSSCTQVAWDEAIVLRKYL